MWFFGLMWLVGEEGETRLQLFMKGNSQSLDEL